MAVADSLLHYVFLHMRRVCLHVASCMPPGRMPCLCVCVWPLVSLSGTDRLGHSSVHSKHILSLVLLIHFGSPQPSFAHTHTHPNTPPPALPPSTTHTRIHYTHTTHTSHTFLPTTTHTSHHTHTPTTTHHPAHPTYLISIYSLSGKGRAGGWAGTDGHHACLPFPSSTPSSCSMLSTYYNTFQNRTGQGKRQKGRHGETGTVVFCMRQERETCRQNNFGMREQDKTGETRQTDSRRGEHG